MSCRGVNFRKASGMTAMTGMVMATGMVRVEAADALTRPGVSR